MNIESITVTNFCSFGEKNNILQINPGVTTIVGMNESGKSNLMNSIGYIDLVNGITTNLIPFRNRINNKPVRMSVRLNVTADDPSDIVGDGITEIILDENEAYEIRGTAIDLYASKVLTYDLQDALQKYGKYENSSDRQNVLNEIKKLKAYCKLPLWKTKSVVQYARKVATSHILDETVRAEAVNYVDSLESNLDSLIARMPFFFSHKSSKNIKNTYSISEVKRSSSDNKDSVDKQPNDLLLSLLTIAGIDRDSLIAAVASGNAAERQTYENRMNRALEQNVMKGFREYYKQGTEDIQMIFRIESNRLNIHVSSGDATTAFSERSNGLRWYLKMYTDLKAQINNERPIVYVLDEPGIYLHINAQNELRNMFFQQAKDGTQILYTTHSPYMIDTNFACIRGIIKTENEEFSCIMNSLYNTTFHAAKCLDTLSPIAAAMGMDLATNPGIDRSKLNIIVEGVTDQIYLRTMADKLGLPPKAYNIIPSTGADNSQHLASILLGWGYPFVVLFDYDNKGKDCAKKLVKQLNLEFGKSVFMLKDLSVTEFDALRSIPQNESIVIETLLSASDRTALQISDTDEKEQKKASAVRFAATVNSGYELSVETCEAFKSLWARIFLNVRGIDAER